MSGIKNAYLIVIIVLLCAIAFSAPGFAKPVQAAGSCGTGSWTSGNLEIHHINIGQGDSTLIIGPTGKSLLFDAGESTWNSHTKAQIIGPYIESVLGCKSLDYVVISHFHLDHIGYVGYGGLWHLVETQGFTVGTTLIRNYNTHLGYISGTFTNWKAYLEGTGQAKLHPTWAIEGTGQVDLGAGVTFNIVAVNGNGSIIAGDFHTDASPPSENDYSIGGVLSYGNFDEWMGGDVSGQYEVGGFGYTYHDIELNIAPEVGDMDVYKVNHHGSSHSSSATFINQLDPEVSIVTVGNSNSYGHPTQVIMDRLLSTSTVYMTERGDLNTNIGSAIVSGNIVIKTSNGSTYTVNGIPYTATEPLRSDTDGDGYFAEADPNDSNSSTTPAPNGGCGPTYQTCSLSSVSCEVTPGQVVINEVLPAPLNNGSEWVELYNTTASTINIGYCYIDDSVGGSPDYQIPASTLISPHGFWTLDRTSYFNNGGDDVRFLKEDATTVLDIYTYGNTAYDVSWYRNPDGGPWAASPTASPTKGQFNAPFTPPTYPSVSSILRADPNPTNADSVNFTVTFSKAVTGVNTSAPFDDFAMLTSGLQGASITGVSGSGTTYTVTVNTGPGSGTIQLVVVDDDSIRDANNLPLGGDGWGNGNYTSGEVYTIGECTFFDVSNTYWAWSFIERLYNAGITGGCSANPLNYCPEGVVTRAQMAVFLLRGIHTSSYTPPAIGAGSGFGDVPMDYWSGTWIKQLAAEGITTGCGNGNFCPEHPVTRAQMAVFLLRSKYGASYAPPAVGTGTGFGDVPPDYWSAAWIKQLVTEGITSGCGNGNYCPETPVTRAQMAVFLVRTFSLP